MNRFFTLLVLLFAFSQFSFAQEMGYGIRVGLNFNTINGPSEVDDEGNALEVFDYNTGFHVGGSIAFKFTDLFGVRTGIFFSQRGMKYKYEGPSFQFYKNEIDEEQVVSDGDRRYRLTVSNSYLEIPITAYYKIGERFEIHGGVLVGILMNSSAIGEFDYTSDLLVSPEMDFTQNLDFNYRKDMPASETIITDETPVFEYRRYTGNTESLVIRFPETVGAYYMDYPVKDGNFYNNFDFGLTGGFSFFINGGLYLMFSANYGLVDVSNNFYDISRYDYEKVGIDKGNYIQREDKDSNLSFQLSIGFSF